MLRNAEASRKRPSGNTSRRDRRQATKQRAASASARARPSGVPAPQWSETSLEGSEEQELYRALLQELDLQHLNEALNSCGWCDDLSIMQSEDADWEDIGVSVNEGRRIREALRSRLGLNLAPEPAPQPGAGVAQETHLLPEPAPHQEAERTTRTRGATRVRARARARAMEYNSPQRWRLLQYIECTARWTTSNLSALLQTCCLRPSPGTHSPQHQSLPEPRPEMQPEPEPADSVGYHDVGQGCWISATTFLTVHEKIVNCETLIFNSVQRTASALLSCWIPAPVQQKKPMEEQQKELSQLRFGELKQRASACGVAEQTVQDTLDAADDPKAAVIELILRHRQMKRANSAGTVTVAAAGGVEAADVNTSSGDRRECPLCFERYCNSSDGKLVPRIPQCGHTVCHGCMASMLRTILPTAHSKPYCCPTCRVVTNVPRGQPSNLPIVYALMD